MCADRIAAHPEWRAIVEGQLKALHRAVARLFQASGFTTASPTVLEIEK